MRERERESCVSHSAPAPAPPTVACSAAQQSALAKFVSSRRRRLVFTFRVAVVVFSRAARKPVEAVRQERKLLPRRRPLFGLCKLGK